MGMYSQANLLDDELSFVHSKEGIIGKFLYKMNKNTPVIFSFQVPKNLYLRAEILCEDIEELSEMPFTQSTLIHLLYNDFLFHCKRNPDPRSHFNLLCNLEKTSGKQTHLQKENDHTFKLVYQETHQEMKKIQIQIKRKIALRGEVLLADMEEVQPQHGFTLERIFELLYVDFIDTFRKGDSTETLNKLLKLIQD